MCVSACVYNVCACVYCVSICMSACVCVNEWKCVLACIGCECAATVDHK